MNINVVENLKAARAQAMSEVHQIDKALQALTGMKLSANGHMKVGVMSTRPPLSADARARIAAAQRKRWALTRKAQKAAAKAAGR